MKVLNLKSAVLNPPRAKKLEEMESIVAEWKHQQEVIEQEDTLHMDDDTRITILMNIMPKEFVKDMRDKLNRERYVSFHDFELALHDEIQERKMDSVANKGQPISALTEEPEGREGEVELVETEVWVEECQAWICGLAPKRERSRSRSRDRGSEESRPRSPKGKGKGACYNCGEEAT